MHKKILSFFFTTTLGSALSSIAIFLSVEQGFQKLTLLGFALAAKTLASAIFSACTPYVISKIGFRNSFIASQVFGFAALTVTAAGFYFRLFPLFIVGIMLTGLPSAFVNILITMTLKLYNSNEVYFRKVSGQRELLTNIALLLSAIAAPLLLWVTNLYCVLLIDASSFWLGLVILKRIVLPDYQESNQTDTKTNYKMLLKKETCIFWLKTNSSLLLAGLIPLLASSNNIVFTQHLPILLRQWFWVVETLVWIFSNLLYIYVIRSSKKSWLFELAMCNAIWAVAFLFFNEPIAIMLIAGWISLLLSLSFQKFRDDYVLYAKDQHESIKIYSAFANFQRNFVFFLSPLLLSFLMQNLSYIMTFTVLILIQIIFRLAVFILEKKKFTSV